MKLVLEFDPKKRIIIQEFVEKVKEIIARLDPNVEEQKKLDKCLEIENQRNEQKIRKENVENQG